MIVLVIAPGIRALAYAVMVFEEHILRAKVIDFDVMHHQTFRKFSFSSLADLINRASVHWLLLSVCFERYTPDLVVLGPPAQNKEPGDYVEACRRVIRTATVTGNIPTIEYQTDAEMWRDMRINRRLVHDLISTVVSNCPNNRFAVRTLCGGIAGASQMMELRIPDVLRETRDLDEL